jgi:hypothetical protein
VVILADACASQPFDEFSAADAHEFALARFRYLFGQTMTAEEFTVAIGGTTASPQPSVPATRTSERLCQAPSITCV